VLRFCRCHARASRDVMAGNRAAVCVGGIITIEGVIMRGTVVWQWQWLKKSDGRICVQIRNQFSSTTYPAVALAKYM
jgi:hypothetical protein